jgi:endonuclease YncB( thermonuclease family)
MVKALQFLLALVIAFVIAGTMFAARNAAKLQSERPDTMKTDAGHIAAAKQAAKAIANAKESASARNVREGPLERVAALQQPTAPLAPKAGTSVPEKQFMRWRLVFHPVATSAGIIQAGSTALVLPGIDVISADETCTTPSGANWPCGMVARTAFRNYLKGRALNCHLPDVPQEKAIVAECLLQGQDPAAWLVERGWARITPDSPFAALADAAKASNRGIHGQPPAGVEVKQP